MQDAIHLLRRRQPPEVDAQEEEDVVAAASEKKSNDDAVATAGERYGDNTARKDEDATNVTFDSGGGHMTVLFDDEI